MAVQYKIYGRDNCDYCIKAVELLKEYGRPYQYIKIGPNITMEQFRELFPLAKTVPQITLDTKYIGGYTELVQHCATTW